MSTPRTSRNTRRRRVGSRPKQIQMLFTCVGRRIELVEAFRDAAADLGLRLTIHGADINWYAPAAHWVDHAHIVPPVKARRHIQALLQLVDRERIDLIIPLIDSDLLALSRAKPRFARQGCHVLISAESVIRVCRDKLLTFQKLRSAGIDTPDTWTWDDVTAGKRFRFPLFLKPREGSAGRGLYRASNATELRVLGSRIGNPIVQEFVEGTEHTLDVYTGLTGEPRCVVPRRRLEVRTGEVSKGVVVKDPAIIEVGRRVIRAIGPCEGVITVQCMVTAKRRIRVIEVNPRFGGGAPLSIHAGANFPKWLLTEFLGRPLRGTLMRYRDAVTMLRYDQSVFLNDVGKLKRTTNRKNAIPRNRRDQSRRPRA
jgi:carbamoyl-phosphate synthase large subunit